MASPIPGFEPLPLAAVEKWHSPEDVADPPFQRPIKAQLAHLEAERRAEALEKERDVLDQERIWAGYALEKERDALDRELLRARYAWRVAVWQVVAALEISVIVGVSLPHPGAISVGVMLLFAFFPLAWQARRHKREQISTAQALAAKRAEIDIAQITATTALAAKQAEIDDTKKQASEHWEKFLKLRQEAEAQIKVLIPEG